MGDFGMSGDDLEQMYQEVILEAARDPHGREHFAADVSKEQGSAPADTTVRASHEYCTPGESHQFNPTCGDEATVHAEVSDSEPHTIERLVWDGHGCSISQASLSVMVDLCAGKTVDEAMELFRDFHELMESRRCWIAGRGQGGEAGGRRGVPGRVQVPDAHQVRAAWLGGHARLRRQGAGGEINGHRTAMRAVRVVLLI